MIIAGTVLPVRATAILAAVLFVSAYAAGAVRAEDAAAGLELAKKNCARCHAIARDDTSAHAEAPPFTEVVTRYPPADLAEALAEGISTGHPDMPEFVFESEQIGDLIAYLETLQ